MLYEFLLYSKVIQLYIYIHSFFNSLFHYGLSQDFFFLINLFIYLFLAALGLRCCAQTFSSCGERGLLFVAVRRLLIKVSSLVVEHRFQARGLQQLWHAVFSSCGMRALLLHGMWDLPRPGLEPVSPALAGGFLTTLPPGQSYHRILNIVLCAVQQDLVVELILFQLRLHLAPLKKYLVPFLLVSCNTDLGESDTKRQHASFAFYISSIVLLRKKNQLVSRDFGIGKNYISSI